MKRSKTHVNSLCHPSPWRKSIKVKIKRQMLVDLRKSVHGY
uniref:Uncharacterized protein n=1 Tax=Anguilla anguilla TaxID=7936 RepID=A0A0E9TK70_ANGAN